MKRLLKLVLGSMQFNVRDRERATAKVRVQVDDTVEGREFEVRIGKSYAGTATPDPEKPLDRKSVFRTLVEYPETVVQAFAIVGVELDASEVVAEYESQRREMDRKAAEADRKRWEEFYDKSILHPLAAMDGTDGMSVTLTGRDEFLKRPADWALQAVVSKGKKSTHVSVSAEDGKFVATINHSNRKWKKLESVFAACRDEVNRQERNLVVEKERADKSELAKAALDLAAKNLGLQKDSWNNGYSLQFDNPQGPGSIGGTLEAQFTSHSQMLCKITSMVPLSKIPELVSLLKK